MSAPQQALLMAGTSSGKPLDAYTANLWGAWSYARLLSAYSGDAARATGGGGIPFGHTTTENLDRVYDQSGSGGYLQQATGAHQPIWPTGGGYIDFTGTSGATWDYLSSNVATPGTHSSMTVYCIHTKQDNTDRVYWELGVTAEAGGARYAYDAAATAPSAASMGPTSGDFFINKAATDTSTNRRVHCVVIDRTQAVITNHIKHYADGSALSSSATVDTGTDPSGNFASLPFVWGARATGPAFGAQCRGHALVVYTTAHDATTVANISAALAGV